MMEKGDVVLSEHRQDVRRVKFVKVIDEDRAFAQPLAVELAPEGLAPARIGDGEVEAVPLAAVPVLCRDVMSQGVGMAVLGHLRIAGGAGGEEH